MKKFIIIALTLILCLCFIGCTKNESNVSSTDNASSNQTLSNNTAKECFEKILNNEQDFYLTYDKTNIFLSDYNLKAWCYSYVDMDNDNIDELAIELESGDVLILRIDGESIIGFEFSMRAMYQINTDGSFLWNKNTGNTYGCSRLEFTGKTYKDIELWRVENNESGSTAYYIDGKAATKGELDSLSAPTSINWNSLSTSSDNTSIVDISSQVEPMEPLTVDQVKQIFEPLLAKGIMVYESIDNDLGQFEYENEISFKTDDGSSYALITDENFKTIDDVWEYAYSAYTKEAAHRLFADNLDQNSTSPRFMEKDGKLYYCKAGRGHVVDFPIETMKIIQQYKDMIIVSIDYCCYNYEPEDSVFVFCKTQDGWRLANSEEEAVSVLPKQFLAQYNHSESVVFQNNSKEYTATIYFENELSNCANHIIITENKSNKQLQKINLTQNEKFGDKSIYAVDVNFDGYNDLIIPHEHPASAVYFKAYIWNVAKQSFVYAPSFENIENFVLDNDNKILLSHRTASRITTYAIHSYDESINDFTLKKLVCWRPSNDEKFMHFTEEEYDTNGEPTIIDDCLVEATDPTWIDERNENVVGYFVDGSFWDLNSTKWKNYFYKQR